MATDQILTERSVSFSQAGARPRAVVIGAGFAGVAAAHALGERGYGVTVLEKAPRAGGRASSFDDRRSGDRCDNGQHLLIGAYRNTRALLDSIGAGADVHFQRHLSVRFVERGGRAFDFRATPGLPAPVHLLAAFLRHPALSMGDRIAAARAARAIMLMSGSELAKTEPLRFSDWLARMRQPQTLVDSFWEVLCIATINAPSTVVSALPILRVLRLSLLSSAEAGRLGWAVVPLGDLVAPRLANYLAERAGELRMRARVRGLEPTSDGARIAAVTLDDGERIAADLFVSALPHEALRGLAAGLVPAGLEPSPIVDVHIWTDREIIDAPFVALLGAAEAQWVWNRGRMLRGGNPSGPMVSITISGALRALDAPPRETEARVLDDLRAFLPAFRRAEVRRILTVKEPYATLRLEPGVEARRPGPRTRYANLFLAGDWTATGLPSTIEGAVISGLRAVEEATGARLVLPLEGREEWPVRLARRLVGADR